MGLFHFFKQIKAIKEELDHVVLDFEENEKLYLKMTTDELKQLSNDDLYHAVITRLEKVVEHYDDIGAKIESLTKEQKVAYVLNYYEIEVNNGGLCQFFVNSSRVCAPYISDYLEVIEAYKHKELFDGFINEHKIDVYDLSSFILKRRKDYNKQLSRYPFDDFDDKFYELDPIEDYLLEYIRQHISAY